MNLRKRLSYQLKETGIELLRIGAITTIFCGPVVGIGYLTRNPEAEIIYESNQRNSQERADADRDGVLSSGEFINFLRFGGKAAIR